MRKLSKILCLCSVLFLASCDYFIPSTWNYRITVEIETPEGVKSGSAVRKVVATLQPKITPETKQVSHRVYGEAVVIDLGERGTVFALINWDSYNEVYKAFPLDANTWKERLKYFNNLEAGTKAELKIDLPRLVTFENLNDPMSVKGVNKKKMHETFGQGVQLKGITIEITNDRVTWGVEKWLPWLDGLNGHYLHGGMTSRNAPLGLHAGNFKTGEK